MLGAVRGVMVDGWAAVTGFNRLQSSRSRAALRAGEIRGESGTRRGAVRGGAGGPVPRSDLAGGVWCDPWTMASDATITFAMDDDAEIGVLSSSVHTSWARLRGSTLEDRIRYTPRSSFRTFPWPAGGLSQVADVSRRLYACRSEICLERQIGLTKLHNQVDDGAWRDLRDLHAELDESVAAAYGWPRAVAHDPDETNRRLLDLNRAITAGEIAYDPFPLPSR